MKIELTNGTLNKEAIKCWLKLNRKNVDHQYLTAYNIDRNLSVGCFCFFDDFWSSNTGAIDFFVQVNSYEALLFLEQEWQQFRLAIYNE